MISAGQACQSASINRVTCMDDIQDVLVSPSGMVKTPRLQTKNVLAKCERSEHEPYFASPAGRHLQGCRRLKMSGTDFPGRRVAAGGGGEWFKCRISLIPGPSPGWRRVII